MANLVRRGQTYYARLFIPRDRQGDVGRALGSSGGVCREVVRTLQVGDRREAQRRLGPALTAIREDVETKLKAKGLRPLTEWVPDWVEKAALKRLSLATASDVPHGIEHDEETGEPLLDSPRDDVVDEIREEYRDVLARHGRQAAERYWTLATEGGTTIRAAADAWLARLEAGKTAKAQTLAGHRTVLALLADFLRSEEKLTPEVALLSDVSRKTAAAFLAWRAATVSPKTGRPIGAATIRREVSTLMGLWRDARRAGLAETNPWEDQTAAYPKVRHVAAEDGEEGPGKRPYRPAELVALIRADGEAWAPNGGGYGPALWDAVRLLLLTGCRANELADARVGDLLAGGRTLRVRTGKTANAARTIPLCDLAAEVFAARLASLTDTAPASPLWPEIPPAGADARRGKVLSTRFAAAKKRILTAAGHDPHGVDLHSTRRSFAEALRDAMNAGCRDITPNLIGVLMGHAGATLALNTYAPGALEGHKRAAIEAMVATGLDATVKAALEDTRGARPAVVRTAPVQKALIQ